MHANIHTYKIQQYYSQIIKSTQQHIIKYKSHHSSHSYILSQFPIQYTTHSISNTPDLPTLQLGAKTLGLRIESKNINSHVLELRL
jgi:hypothetical protein